MGFVSASAYCDHDASGQDAGCKSQDPLSLDIVVIRAVIADSPPIGLVAVFMHL